MGEFLIKDLHKIFSTGAGDVVALADINLRVEDREFVAIVGASGSGKSSLLNLVAGFEHPSQGEVLLDGKPVSGPGPDRGVVFQQSSLYPWLTVRKNVLFGLRLAANRRRVGNAAERDSKADEMIRRVGLEAFKNSLPSQLSGGMRQRAAIASVLAINPEVLLMDEPFGALDSLTRSLMQDFLLELWESERKTVLLVTHDITEAIYLADRVIVMAGHPGRIREVIDVDLQRPRVLATQGQQRFLALREHVTAVVRDEVSKAEAFIRA